MGKLHYLAGDESFAVKMDDDALAAFEEVFLERFGNDEPFHFQVNFPRGQEARIVVVWLHKYSSIKFAYDNPVVETDTELISNLKDELTERGGIFLD